MRRKSNFAPGDSEEREDERCSGLHSNDTLVLGCVSACRNVRRARGHPPFGGSTQFSRNIKPAISVPLRKVPLTKLSHRRWEITLKDESARRGSFPPSSLTDTSSPANKSHNRRAGGGGVCRFGSRRAS